MFHKKNPSKLYNRRFGGKTICNIVFIFQEHYKNDLSFKISTKSDNLDILPIVE